jgi:hypothetical protein
VTVSEWLNTVNAQAVYSEQNRNLRKPHKERVTRVDPAESIPEADERSYQDPERKRRQCAGPLIEVAPRH